MDKPLLKLEEYKDKSIWKKIFTEETAKLFEDNELVPLDLIDITSEELEELIKSRSLESKSKVRRLKRELETLDEVKKEKKLEVEEVIDIIGKALYFSKIDLKSAYTQIGLSSESRDVTTFTWQNRRFKFTRIPFGLKVAPSCFQRNIQLIIQRERCSEFAINYFDDFIVFSNSIQEHQDHVERIFQILLKYNLTVSKEKVHLFKKEIIILGHVISQNKIKINEKKFINMLEWERPSDKKRMMKFLGFLNYFRGFIIGFPELTRKFNEICYTQDHWEWNNELENLFRII